MDPDFNFMQIFFFCVFDRYGGSERLDIAISSVSGFLTDFALIQQVCTSLTY